MRDLTQSNPTPTIASKPITYGRDLFSQPIPQTIAIHQARRELALGICLKISYPIACDRIPDLARWAESKRATRWWDDGFWLRLLLASTPLSQRDIICRQLP